jgi:putative spermidine/putrescine transport system permease protein
MIVAALPLTAADAHEGRMNLLYRQVPPSSPLAHAEVVSRSALPRLSRLLSQPYIWLLLPAVLALTLFFLLPLLNMIKYSVYTQGVAGGMLPDFTLENFRKFFAQDLYWRVLLRTLGNALVITLLALLLGYPMAFAIARGHPTLRCILTVAVISPLLVGIVIRTYGWTVLLSRQGLVNQVLRALGLIEAPLHLMGNDVGVIINLLHVFYPFMVIPLAILLGTAAALGLTRYRFPGRELLNTFLMLPLIFPSIITGIALLQFSSTRVPEYYSSLRLLASPRRELRSRLYPHLPPGGSRSTFVFPVCPPFRLRVSHDLDHTFHLDDTRPPWVTHASSPPCRPHTPWCDGEEPKRLRLHSAGSTIPHLGPTDSSGGWPPLDCDPVVLRKPFRPHLTVSALPSGVPHEMGSGSPWLCLAFAFVPV